MIANRFFAVATLVSAISGVALAQSDNPLVGTWKLNVAKSKAALFKSGTTKVEAVGDGVKFTVDVVATDGTTSHWSFTANYDGKDNPVTGNSPYGDVVAVTRIDPRTTQLANKKGGKPTATQTIVVSSDGKTRTTTSKGTNAKGEALDTVAFYEKQ
jgi:hypothetical protein